MVLSTLLTLGIVTLPCKVFQILLITSGLCYQKPNISTMQSFKSYGVTASLIRLYLHYAKFKILLMYMYIVTRTLPLFSSPSKVLNRTHAHIYIYNTNLRLHFHRFKLAFPLMSFPLRAVDTIGSYSK